MIAGGQYQQGSYLFDPKQKVVYQAVDDPTRAKT